MHREVRDWLAAQFADLPDGLRVFEVGSKAINGSARDAARPGQVAAWWGCDLVSGAGVDFVGPGEEAVPPWPADVAVCCEVGEHTPRLAAIVDNLARQVRPGGVLLLTMATEPRAPHSAVDGGPLRHGEYYRNVEPDVLRAQLLTAGAEAVTLHVDRWRGDLYASARRPELLSL
jgi:SAM-dependent methyltransferase